MRRSRNLAYLTLALLALLASGCSEDASPPAPVAAGDPPPAAATIPTGKAAYERACATCHEEGKDGAPATGDRQAWASRSPLWEGVLYEHATSGYFNMPAMGGSAALEETEVEAAAEYMLSLTFPDRPDDPH